MPKGKTNQKLTFVVPPNWINHDVFEALSQQGHIIVPLPQECLNADIVFGTNCHILTDAILSRKGIIDVALRAARKRKKEKKHETSS